MTSQVSLVILEELGFHESQAFSFCQFSIPNEPELFPLKFKISLKNEEHHQKKKKSIGFHTK